MREKTHRPVAVGRRPSAIGPASWRTAGVRGATAIDAGGAGAGAQLRATAVAIADCEGRGGRSPPRPRITDRRRPAGDALPGRQRRQPGPAKRVSACQRRRCGSSPQLQVGRPRPQDSGAGRDRPPLKANLNVLLARNCGMSVLAEGAANPDDSLNELFWPVTARPLLGMVPEKADAARMLCSDHSGC